MNHQSTKTPLHTPPNQNSALPKRNLFLDFLQKQFSSVAQSCPTFCDPMDAARQASLSITNSWILLKLMSIEPVMSSKHLNLCCPLLLLPSVFPSIRVFSPLNTYISKDLRTQIFRARDRKDSTSSTHHLFHFFKSKFP